MNYAMDEDEVAAIPPNAVDVARRAAILKLLFVRVATTPSAEIFAELSASWSHSESAEFQAELELQRVTLVADLRAHDLWELTSPLERQVFEVPASLITLQQRVSTSWRAECIGCLAWAMGLMKELPGYDEQMDPEQVVPLIPVESIDFATTALRPSEEIERARDIAELWHWRSRTRQLTDDGSATGYTAAELDAIVRQVSLRVAANGLLTSTVDDDFPVSGKAYRDLSSEEWSNAQSIAMERHFAFNWLCGFAPGNEWDETPTDT